MEIIKRKIGYQDLGVTPNLTFTATTFYFPLFLTQSYEDIGIYTDVKDSLADVVTGFTSAWNLSYDGNSQKDCKTSNKCLVTSTVSPATFYNASDGSLNVTITNPNSLECPSPVTINWTGPDGFDSSNLNNNSLKAGNYTLKITDINCDRTIKTYYIPQPGPLDSEIGINNSQVNDTNGTCNGSATVTVTGGRPPYTFDWYSAGTTTPVLGTSSTLTNLCIGDYYVVITDFDGTVVTEFFNISQPPPLSGTVKNTINIDCQGNSGYIKVQGIGGYITNGYTYTLGSVTNNTGIFDSNITTPNTYNVVINDNGGSTFILPVVITQPVTPISVTYAPTVTNNDGFQDTAGVTGNLSYNISGGQGVNGDYYVTLAPVFNTTSTTNSPPLNSTVGAGGYQFDSSGSFIGLQSGWYQLIVTDSVCEYSQNIYIPHLFDLSVDVTNYGGGRLEVITTNGSTYKFAGISWSDGIQYICPTVLGGTPCVTHTLLSDPHPSGTDLTLEVLWVNITNPNNSTLWRTFKRKYKVP